MSIAEKRAQLRELLKERSLSPLQAGLWVQSRLLPRHPVNNVSVVYRLAAEVDVDRLERACRAIYARHEALRSVYPELDGEPRVRLSDAPFVLHRRSGELSDVRAEVERGFDLTTEVPLRVTFWPDERVLSVVAHHIAVDGASMTILLEEARSRQLRAVPVEPALLRWPKAAPAEQGERPFAGDAPAWQPTDRKLAFSLSEPLVQRLRALAREERMTLFDVLLAGYQVAVMRTTGASRFLLGTPGNGRARPELARTVGCLAEVLSVPTCLDGSRTLRETLRSPRTSVSGGFPELLFSWHARRAVVPWGDAEGDLLYCGQGGATGAVVTTLWARGEGIEGMVEHRASCLSDAQPLLDNYRAVLEQLVYESEARTYQTVLDRFLHQARRRPEHPAIIDERGEWSYAELRAEVERLAPSLARSELTAICADRSREVVATMLAAHAAGCGYLPLDPEWPQERTAGIVAEARLLKEDGVAYVLYTSGSTGRPKGVVIEQRALANAVTALARRLEIDQEVRWLAVTPLTFDIATLELLLPLTVGGTVVIAPRAAGRDPAALLRLVEQHRINLLQATPATWQMLPTIPPLKMLCGGDTLPPSLVRGMLAGGGRLFNLYGPTEATIWATVAELFSADEVVSIGTPIDNLEAQVLGEDGEIAEAGELYLGGAGLARGYLNRPDLTAERFVTLRGRRLYRTGDRVRRLPDGQLEFLGRVDNQVKVRGHRIELEEVEAAILEQPGVRAAAVAVRGDRLVAFYCGGPVSEPDLRSRLPESMVPTAWTELPAMPLTAHGKLDRAALPEVARVVSEPPVDVFESTLARHWERILKVPSVGRHDNFFALGGTSLSVVRLFAQLGGEHPVSLLLGAPTVAQLALALREQRSPGERWRSLVPLQPLGERPPLFLVHARDGSVVAYRELADRLRPDQPVLGLQVPPGPLPATLEELASHYVAEIRQLQPWGPYRVGGLCVGGLIAYEVARQLGDVSHLVIVDKNAPGYGNLLPTGGSWRGRLRGLGVRWHHHRAVLRRLPLRERWGYALQRLRRESEPAGEARASVMPLAERYRALPYAGRVTLFMGLQPRWFGTDPCMGWEALAGEVVRYSIPSAHGTVMLTDPVLGFWIDDLRRVLAT